MSLICADCGLQLSTVKIGVVLIEMFANPPRPYAIRSADKLGCPRCGKHTYRGADKTTVRHHEDDFNLRLAEALEGEHVIHHESRAMRDLYKTGMEQPDYGSLE